MAGIPPVPLLDIKDLSPTFQEWLRQLRTFVSNTSGLIPWVNIDKTGAALTDIPTRNHDTLQNISGGTSGDYQHLTTAQWQHASTLGTRTVKSVAGGADVTLSTGEAQSRILECTGVITANINVIVPTAVWDWIVFNNTTGAFTLTVKTSGGTGIAVAQTKRAILYCDNTNVVRATGDV